MKDKPPHRLARPASLPPTLYEDEDTEFSAVVREAEVIFDRAYAHRDPGNPTFAYFFFIQGFLHGRLDEREG